MLGDMDLQHTYCILYHHPKSLVESKYLKGSSADGTLRSFKIRKRKQSKEILVCPSLSLVKEVGWLVYHNNINKM